ncbi:MAG TPA: VWA domain-containing protein [Candidatus Acidoferrales bacterium]|nr:VWA domain-containing protein [Candidatus Acidoferrales bacterium]
MSKKPPKAANDADDDSSRYLFFLFITCIAVAMHVLAVSRSAQAVPQSNTQKPPIIRSTTRVISVNVVVIDREGRPVPGLTKDDFQLFDDGRAEDIAFFSTGGDETGSPNSVHPLAPGEYTNDPHKLGLADEGATIILFDTVNSAYLSQAYALGAVRIFLRQLHPEDRIGIYVLNKDGLKVVYDVSQPASGLLEAMQRYDQAHLGGASGKTTTPVGDSSGSMELDLFLRGKEDRQPFGHCGGQIPLMIAGFQEIARSTVGLRGRKAIIWVTERPPLSPFPWGEGNALDHLRGHFCGTDYDPDFIVEEPANLKPLPGPTRSRSVESGETRGSIRDRGLANNDESDLMVRLFTQNDIVLYPVSAEGLQTLRIFGPGGAATIPLTPDDLINGVDAVANVESHQAMDVMARRTGGRAFYNRNDLETGIRRALDDAKYGYELAYYADHDRWNGDWHKTDVKVNRPGVAVLARAGYFAFPEPKLLPPKASKQLIEEIAASPLEDTEIPITVKITTPSSPVGSRIDVRVFLSAQNLFANHGDGWKSQFEVLYYQLTTSNGILSVTTKNVGVELAEAQYSKALEQGVGTEAELQLKRGAALLYVIVHDKRTDAVGSVRIPLDQYTGTLY